MYECIQHPSIIPTAYPHEVAGVLEPIQAVFVQKCIWNFKKGLIHFIQLKWHVSRLCIWNFKTNAFQNFYQVRFFGGGHFTSTHLTACSWYWSKDSFDGKRRHFGILKDRAQYMIPHRTHKVFILVTEWSGESLNWTPNLLSGSQNYAQEVGKTLTTTMTQQENRNKSEDESWNMSLAINKVIRRL